MALTAAVRVRGVPDTHRKARETLQSLRLHQKNNCMLFPDTDTHAGMLVRAKDYIAYGPVSTETVETLLQKRAQVNGVPLADEIESLGYGSVSELAAALEDENVHLQQLQKKGLKLPFRLSPPSKGFKNTRGHYNQSGSLGERDDMDALLKRMI